MAQIPGADVAMAVEGADLLSLIGGDVALRRAAGTHGGEYAGPCPACGGEDRFRVWPAEHPPRFWCRGCDAKGDAIDYLRLSRRLGFAEAYAALTGRIPESREEKRRMAATETLTAAAATAPPVEWQLAAADVATACADALWGRPEPTAMRYLRERRGLLPETIAEARLGVNATSRDVAGLRVPAGITIPWALDGDLWQIKVRLPQGAQGRYASVPGGHPLLYVPLAETWRDIAEQPLVIVEGELDALLLRQELTLGHLERVAVVTFGSAGAKTIPEGIRATFASCWPVLIATDADGPGDEAAAALTERLGRRICARLRPPAGKDIGEAWAAGCSLADWIRTGIALAESTARERPLDTLRESRTSEAAPVVVEHGASQNVPISAAPAVVEARCTVPGCGGAAAVSPDPETGAWCGAHFAGQSVMDAALILDFPDAAALGGPAAGSAAWLAAARDGSDADRARLCAVASELLAERDG